MPPKKKKTLSEADAAEQAQLKADGNTLYQEGDYAGAINLYTLAFDICPASDEAAKILSNRATCHTLLKQHDEALADAIRCTLILPRWTKGHMRKAAALEGLERWDEALDAYNNVMVIEPRNQEVSQKIVAAREACVSRRLGGDDPNVASGAAAPPAPPKRTAPLSTAEVAKVAAHKAKGNALFGEKQYKAARAEYNAAIAIDSGTAALYSNRSNVLLLLGKPEEAAVDARAAIALEPEWPRGHVRLGTALRDADPIASAVSFTRAAELDVSSIDTTDIAVAVRRADERRGRIRPLVARVMAGDSFESNEDAQRCVCDILHLTGSDQDAQREFTLAVWVAVGHNGGVRYNGKAFATQACAYEALRINACHGDAWFLLWRAGGGTVDGKAYGAENCLEQLLQLDPSHGAAWLNLGRTGGTVGHLKHTRRDCYVRCAELESCHTDAWCSLGSVGGGTVHGTAYTRQECFVKALEMDSNSSSAWFNLGNAHGGRIGGVDYSQLECYEQVLRLKPEHPAALNSVHALRNGGRVAGLPTVLM
jgi:tetratricopeptide (TPR) repeat protein